MVTHVLSRLTTVRIEPTGKEVSLHSVEQETLGYQRNDKIWGIGAHVNKVQGLRRSKKDTVTAT